MICNHPPYHELSIEVFSILMKSSPNSYHQQVPSTNNQDLNLFIKKCLTVNYLKRPSVKQLLNDKFIIMKHVTKNIEIGTDHQDF